MLARAVRLKLAAFALISAMILGYTGFRYADLGHLAGVRGYYVTRLELADAGGIFPDANVTFRGVSVGRVGAVRLTATGIEADLRISDSAPPIPDRLTAVVADLSPIGEQYVDLLPRTTAGPYLRDGSVIPQRDSRIPLPVTSLLSTLNATARSLPLGALRTVTTQLALGFGGQGTTLQVLLDGSHRFVLAAAGSTAHITGLISDSKVVLATQIAEGSALVSFAASARLLARQLAASDADLRRLIGATPGAARQVAGLLADTSPALAQLIAHLLTAAEIGGVRISALDELLSGLPVALVDVSSALSPEGINVGLTLTFFNPLPCTLGYGGTVHRNGLDTGPAPPLNASARCLEPARSGIDVRGSAHAPFYGILPPAASPGLAGLLGLNGAVNG